MKLFKKFGCSGLRVSRRRADISFHAAPNWAAIRQIMQSERQLARPRLLSVWVVSRPDGRYWADRRLRSDKRESHIQVVRHNFSSAVAFAVLLGGVIHRAVLAQGLSDLIDRSKGRRARLYKLDPESNNVPEHLDSKFLWACLMAPNDELTLDYIELLSERAFEIGSGADTFLSVIPNFRFSNFYVCNFH